MNSKENVAYHVLYDILNHGRNFSLNTYTLSWYDNYVIVWLMRMLWNVFNRSILPLRYEEDASSEQCDS